VSCGKPVTRPRGPPARLTGTMLNRPASAQARHIGLCIGG